MSVARKQILSLIGLLLLSLSVSVAWGQSAPAAMISPAPGSKLAGASVTFSWSAGTNVSRYALYIGTQPAQYNIASVGTARTATITAMPTNGGAVYVALYSLINGVWSVNTYTYTASGTPAIGVLTSPTPGTKLASTTTTFRWSPGVGVTKYWLYLGSAPGKGDIATVSTGTGTGAALVGLPANGGTIYATLYSYVNGVYQTNAYTYTAPGTPVAATMVSPASGATFSSQTQTFTWTPGTGVTSYRLYVGSTKGANDIDSIVSSNTSATLSNLPVNGKPVYVTLMSYIDLAYQSAYYTYTAAKTSAHTVDLAWNASTSTGISGYNVYRAPYTTSCGTFTKLNGSLLSTTSFVDSVVTNGSAYCYAATAVDTANIESTYSNIASDVVIPTT